MLITTVAATPVSAAEVTTPYPSVAVGPGQTSTFDLQITSDESEVVDVQVAQAPDGWTTVLRGDGRQVEADPPEGVAAGPYEIGVQAK